MGSRPERLLGIQPLGRLRWKWLNAGSCEVHRLTTDTEGGSYNIFRDGLSRFYSYLILVHRHHPRSRLLHHYLWYVDYLAIVKTL